MNGVVSFHFYSTSSLYPFSFSSRDDYNASERKLLKIEDNGRERIAMSVGDVLSFMKKVYDNCKS